MHSATAQDIRGVAKMKSRWIQKSGFCLVLLALAGICWAATYAIPADQLDPKMVYWGSTTGFEKGAEVNFGELFKMTPEFAEMKKKKVEKGSGRYFQLYSTGINRVIRSITEVGHETDYDFVAAEGYLGGLNPAIPADDITELVAKALEDALKADK